MFDLLIIAVFLLNIGFILGAAVILLVHFSGFETMSRSEEELLTRFSFDSEESAAASE